ncbi:golgin subfamily A member 4-like isoform X2 [Panicum virgatum]|uniref:golgin subfamily A member 4-like isoform X2 n=1 Tax=Panicum virgatum TaxID=38727 RepID=UPI0019D69D18|nr:golgin subfamily A member 4-like isoform X2 [Panicum virgatum]
MSGRSNGHYPANGAKVLHMRHRNKEKVQLDRNDAASRACQKDRQHIEKLEIELMNCYQEIDYLQDQLNIRNVEANIMGEHIHSLELKLTELEKFPERVRVMDNELMRSDSQCWILMEEVRCKEEELQKASSQIKKLESTVLDSQSEIESLKLDLTNLEQRLLDAESFAQHAAEHKARIDKLLGEHELQLREAQKTIDQLVLENKQLKEFSPVKGPKPSTSGEQLDKTLENGGHAEYGSDNLILERMAKQNVESELLIEQLKEELREQKLKAKEDAEDLTQEMAELRYQITGMLDEEYKRRSCIEQAAIQHIQGLETQVSKEKTKLSGALRRLQESRELAHKQAMEIKKLKDALEVWA